MRWMWSRYSHPNVLDVLSLPAADLGWCDRLETAAGNALTGKVLCVCAADAVARAGLAACPDSPQQAGEVLELLGSWIDEPTDERFERICSTIFAEEEPP